MAGLAIIWRNPNSSHHLRRWAHVRRDDHRSLYLVLEAVSEKDNTWEGLPTLEVLHAKPAPPKKAGILHKLLAGT